MRSKARSGLGILLLLILSSCVSGPREGDAAAETGALIRRLQAEIVQLTRQVAMLEGTLPLLACGPELRSLLNRIRQECNGDLTSADGNNSCTTNKLKGAMTQAQHELQVSSIGLTLLGILRHEVVYLDDRSDHPTSTRETRLTTLAGEKEARDTRFIVVVSPERGAPAAERRAKVVIDQLRKLGIDAARIERPWIYDLHIPVNQLKPADRPGAAEPKDIGRAVFVLRTEC